MGLGSFLGSLVGSGTATTIEGIANVVDKFVETPQEKEAARIVVMKLQQERDKAQIELNKVEANHRTVFVAGWRPFLGWVCGVGIAYHFIVMPMLTFIVTIIMKQPPTFPVLAIGELITLVFAMLGLSTTRTYEKEKNLTN